MKKLLIAVLVLICCAIPIDTQESIRVIPRSSFNGKADFRKTFEVIMKHEGYYANTPNDRGRETYAGISRVYNPNWYGWRYVDDYKKKNKLKLRMRIPELDTWVLDYYLNIWVKERFYDLEDQDVADYVFDFRINGTVGTRLAQRALRDLDVCIPLTNRMDSVTIHAINSVKKEEFLSRLQHRRIIFYKNIAKKDSTQKGFLKHWLKRTKLR